MEIAGAGTHLRRGYGVPSMDGNGESWAAGPEGRVVGKMRVNLRGDDAGIGKVGAVFEAFGSEPANVGIFIQLRESSSGRYMHLISI